MTRILSSRASFKTLDVRGSPWISDKGLGYISYHSITELNVDDCLSFKGEIPFCFKHLTKLSCAHTAITNKGITQICSLNKHLRELDLSGNGLIDDDLLPLEWIYSLKTLSLNSCDRLTTKALSFVAPLTSLQILRLNNFKNLTDRGLEYLVALPLEKLSLAKCRKLTDKGLMHLKKIKTLKILNLSGCLKISEKAIAALEAEGVKIIS
jgi:hypothetical protein